ncbi:MAG: peptidoglycan-binding protein [Candidatus Binatia bacterium]
MVILAALLVLGACSSHGVEERARQAEKKIKASIPDVEGRALAQKTTPEQVKRAQAALTVANEYQGEINGQLDAVTVNAIEAFQRSRGIKADGILNEKTERSLQAVLARNRQ